MARPELADADLILAAYAQDREVTRYLTWQPHRSVDETRAYVESRIASWEAGQEFTWLIRLHDGRLIGAIGLRVREFKANVGYVLARPHWGQGYAAEALGVILNWALAQPAIHRVWAVCDVDNTRSARVLEKVGMTREGVLRRWILHPQLGETPRDCLCYAIVKERSAGP